MINMNFKPIIQNSNFLGWVDGWVGAGCFVFEIFFLGGGVNISISIALRIKKNPSKLFDGTLMVVLRTRGDSKSATCVHTALFTYQTIGFVKDFVCGRL